MKSHQSDSDKEPFQELRDAIISQAWPEVPKLVDQYLTEHLFKAIERGDTELLSQVFIRNGAAFNQLFNQDTAFSLAVRKERLQDVIAMLEIIKKSPGDFSKELTLIIRTLPKLIKTQPSVDLAKTPPYKVINKIVDILLEIDTPSLIDRFKYADLKNAIMNEDIRMFSILLKIPMDIKNDQYLNLLHFFIENGNWFFLKNIVGQLKNKEKNDPEVAKILGIVLLQLLKGKKFPTKGSRRSYTQLLLDAGADVHQTIDGQNCLHLAVQLKDDRLVRLLVKSGAKIDQPALFTMPFDSIKKKLGVSIDDEKRMFTPIDLASKNKDYYSLIALAKANQKNLNQTPSTDTTDRAAMSFESAFYGLVKDKKIKRNVRLDIAEKLIGSVTHPLVRICSARSLREAITDNDVELVERILTSDKMQDPRILTEDFTNAVQHAIEKKHWDCLMSMAKIKGIDPVLEAAKKEDLFLVVTQFHQKWPELAKAAAKQYCPYIKKHKKEMAKAERHNQRKLHRMASRAQSRQMYAALTLNLGLHNEIMQDITKKMNTLVTLGYMEAKEVYEKSSTNIIKKTAAQENKPKATHLDKKQDAVILLDTDSIAKAEKGDEKILIGLAQLYEESNNTSGFIEWLESIRNEANTAAFSKVLLHVYWSHIKINLELQNFDYVKGWLTHILNETPHDKEALCLQLLAEAMDLIKNPNTAFITPAGQIQVAMQYLNDAKAIYPEIVEKYSNVLEKVVPHPTLSEYMDNDSVDTSNEVQLSEIKKEEEKFSIPSVIVTEFPHLTDLKLKKDGNSTTKIIPKNLPSAESNPIEKIVKQPSEHAAKQHPKQVETTPSKEFSQKEPSKPSQGSSFFSNLTSKVKNTPTIKQISSRLFTTTKSIEETERLLKMAPTVPTDEPIHENKKRTDIELMERIKQTA